MNKNPNLTTVVYGKAILYEKPQNVTDEEWKEQENRREKFRKMARKKSKELDDLYQTTKQPSKNGD